MKSSEITRIQLAALLDHTNLKPFAVKTDFERLCREAAENHFAMVAVNPAQVKLCRDLLEGTKVHVGAAIAFPLGQLTIEEKVQETRAAIQDGADEIDYVLNIGKLKDRDFSFIESEMKWIVGVCREKNVCSKVIFENCYLTKDEIRKAAEISAKVLPDFIKTSTGFGTGGATLEDVALMKSIVGNLVKIKAAGGIRNWETCAAMIDAGAERIGTSSSIAIINGFDRAHSR